MSCPALSFADPLRMILQPNGKGSFFLTGQHVVGVQALDVEVDYDSSLLLNPSVMINGGELKQVKNDTQGKLFVSIFRPVADANLRIILNFSTREDRAGGIQHISISAITRSMANRPPEPNADQPSGVAEDEFVDGPADASSLTRADGAVLKADPAPDRNEVIDGHSAAKETAFQSGAERKAHAEQMTFLMHEEKSVLQRFKIFKGEKTLDSFTALFGRSEDERTVQEPAIAISDGKTPVLIRLEVQPEGMHSASIALADARLISKETNEKGIVITVLPSEGTWDARLAIAAGREILDYPLVVAPPINLANGINEHNFLDALRAYINNQSPPLQRESGLYLSEYIFTANYLAGLKKKGSPIQSN
jgi:hypothetical protein